MTHHFEEFYTGCCLWAGDGSIVPADRFHGFYRYWCARNLVEPLGDSWVRALLEEKQIGRIMHESAMHYQGMVLIGRYVPEFIVEVESEVLWDPDLRVDPLAAPFLGPTA
ncbi:hypothetical protein SAMN04488693_1456 [Arthrobacter subterraneus]|uniref:Uncharacterized protein n=1 Tax=Arthrobacter subterraneus TaxID=335973 RepID=A0A1G8Q7T4_9MICC|nr:hypothetical protein [Arthrobacter subterraneus]SDJ00889.1 hypothetical protein SAMN04488693_1456 [Arthrobacter subterraneus]